MLWSGSNESSNQAYLEITPTEWSSVYISMTSSSKSRISGTQKLYATDKSVSVDNGNALAKNEFLTLDIDKWTELAYKSSTNTGNTIEVTKGRAWISSNKGESQVILKNYTITANEWSIFMVEQNGPYSYLYSLKWKTEIHTNIGNQLIANWSMVQLTKSDIENPTTKITDWIKPIEWSILEYPLFVRNNGSNLLQNIVPETNSTGTISTWTTNTWSATNSTKINAYIEITEPKSWIMTKTSTITVMGNILSKDVKRITINNVDATISPVNETFVMQGMHVSGDVIDIVYKVYDTNNTLLQSWVHTIFGDKNIGNTNTSLVPETYNLSAKDFVITSPTSNPYTTTEKFLKVQWTIPKNTVEYIMVNDYKLQKFIPKSGSWYYFANTEAWTMTDGFNLYTIKFYWADNKLLYTQPFTIIKESSHGTASGE